MIKFKANNDVLSNFTFRPNRRFGVDTATFSVYSNNADRRLIGLYEPEKNQLLITPEDWTCKFSPALKARISAEDKP